MESLQRSGLRISETVASRVKDVDLAADSRINIGASLSLDLRIYSDVSHEEYVPEEYLGFLDEGARAVFDSQEARTLITYRWTGVTEATALANPPGIEQTSSIELLMDREGIPIRPSRFREFDHTLQCGDL